MVLLRLLVEVSALCSPCRKLRTPRLAPSMPPVYSGAPKRPPIAALACSSPVRRQPAGTHRPQVPRLGDAHLEHALDRRARRRARRRRRRSRDDRAGGDAERLAGQGGGEAPDAVVGGDAEAQVGEAEALGAVLVGHAEVAAARSTTTSTRTAGALCTSSRPRSRGRRPSRSRAAGAQQRCDRQRVDGRRHVEAGAAAARRRPPARRRGSSAASRRALRRCRARGSAAQRAAGPEVAAAQRRAPAARCGSALPRLCASSSCSVPLQPAARSPPASTRPPSRLMTRTLRLAVAGAVAVAVGAAVAGADDAGAGRAVAAPRCAASRSHRPTRAAGVPTRPAARPCARAVPLSSARTRSIARPARSTPSSASVPLIGASAALPRRQRPSPRRTARGRRGAAPRPAARLRCAGRASALRPGARASAGERGPASPSAAPAVAGRGRRLRGRLQQRREAGELRRIDAQLPGVLRRVRRRSGPRRGRGCRRPPGRASSPRVAVAVGVARLALQRHAGEQAVGERQRRLAARRREQLEGRRGRLAAGQVELELALRVQAIGAAREQRVGLRPATRAPDRNRRASVRPEACQGRRRAPGCSRPASVARAAPRLASAERSRRSRAQPPLASRRSRADCGAVPRQAAIGELAGQVGAQLDPGGVGRRRGEAGADGGELAVERGLRRAGVERRRAGACRASSSTFQRSAVQRPLPAILPPPRRLDAELGREAAAPRSCPGRRDGRAARRRARCTGSRPSFQRPARALRRSSAIRAGRSRPLLVAVARPLRLVAGASLAKAERSSASVDACSSPSGQAANGRTTALRVERLRGVRRRWLRRARSRRRASSASGPAGARARLPRRRGSPPTRRSTCASIANGASAPIVASPDALARVVARLQRGRSDAARRSSAPRWMRARSARRAKASSPAPMRSSSTLAARISISTGRRSVSRRRRRRSAPARAASPGSSVTRSACRLAIVRCSQRPALPRLACERLPARRVEAQHAAAAGQGDVDALGREVAEQRAARRDDLQLRHQGQQPGAAGGGAQRPDEHADRKRRQHQQQRRAAAEPARRSAGGDAAAARRAGSSVGAVRRRPCSGRLRT